MKLWRKTLSLLMACILMLGLYGTIVSASSYSDVSDNAWYTEAAEALLEKGLMNGTGNGRFSPDTIFSRAQFAAVLYGMAGAPAVSGEDSFTDTLPGSWYTNAVLWAEQNKIIAGYGGGKFGPNDPTTQEQLAAMLWSDAGAYHLDSEEETGASSWAVDAVRWIKAEGLINENGLAFEPKKPITRAQVADIVYRYLQLKEKYADAVSGATPVSEEPGQDGKEEGKILVVYFSATGTTKGVAERIADVTGGDLYEILAAEPYTSDDLNYSNRSSRCTKEQNDKSVRPQIGSEDISLEGYTTIYLGFPIWWGEEPRILDTFVEKYNFEGITVIPFCTSASSGIGRSGSNMEALAGSGTWLEGKRFSGRVSKEELQSWIDGLK